MGDRHTLERVPSVRVLFSAERIQERVREMGLEIARDLGHSRPLFIGILKGACMFVADLARATPLDVQLDFISASSYGQGTTSSGKVRVLAGPREDLAGRDVILCEGVADSGRSLSVVLGMLRERRPASLRIAALVDKVPCREVPVEVDYVGWTIEREFVVGYGMDAGERFRNLPYVGVLEEG